MVIFEIKKREIETKDKIALKEAKIAEMEKDYKSEAHRQAELLSKTYGQIAQQEKLSK